MARDNLSKYIILGMLGIKPMSGYDMKYWITKGVGYFSSISYGQIYPALKSFIQEGLVICETEREEGRPEKKTYTITERGRSELEGWLREPMDFGGKNCESLLTVKVFFGSNVEKEATLKHIEDARRYEDMKLKGFLEVERRMEEYGETAGRTRDNSFIFRLSTLREGITISRARLEWCRQTLEYIEKEGV